MNYITEINSFYRFVQTNNLSTGQIALWHALIQINSNLYWQEWFNAPNIILELYTGLSRQAIVKNRNILKQFGLIDFKSNGTKASTYKMLTMSNSLQDSLQSSLQNSLQDSLQGSLQDSLQNSRTYINKDKDKDKNKVKENIKKSFDELIEEYTEDEKLRELLTEYVKLRKSKKPLTEYALKLAFSSLDKLASTQTEKQEIVKATIVNGWSGFFPLKKTDNKGANKGLNNFSGDENRNYSEITEKLMKKQGEMI